MRVYHRTELGQMRAIRAGGFTDATRRYLSDTEDEGVWLADHQLDEEEAARGRYVLELDIPESILEPFEWPEEGKGYREFLVPAKVVNQHGQPKVWESLPPEAPS